MDKMPDHADIYSNQSQKYDLFVSFEDYKNELLKTIIKISPLSENMIVADIGSGTGRIAYLLRPLVKKVYGIEPNDSMRGIAISKSNQQKMDGIEFLQGGYAQIPIPNNFVDLVIEGWSFLYYYKLSLPNWKNKIDHALIEIKRILKPNGKIILIETLGTMETEPKISDFAMPFYKHLEDGHDFKKIDIRTDYKFNNVEEAEKLITFFFGEDMGKMVCQRKDIIVPECTGLWYK
jgi:ubiquinone/menaquinone biosynthesis C-methylase UbiE